MQERITSLDGLRAIAILLVFAAHAFFFVIGWVGVDLFFSLSGFLITGILRRDRIKDDFWSRFYTRRSTRILPPLLILLTVSGLFFFPGWKELLLYTFFAGNLAEWLYRGHSLTLGVLWSLAVEEHFYFFWPFAVRLLPRQMLIVLICVLVTAEPILRALATPHFSTFWPIFLLTPFRFDGLLLGSLLALLLEDPSKRPVLKRWSGPVFLSVAVVWSYAAAFHRFDRAGNTILFNSLGYSLLALGATSLLGYVLLHPVGWVAKALSLRPLVFLGVVSYGFYLFHVVIIKFIQRWTSAHHVAHDRLLTPLTFSVTLCVAALSFYAYELPIVQWGKRVSARNLNEALVTDRVDAA